MMIFYGNILSIFITLKILKYLNIYKKHLLFFIFILWDKQAKDYLCFIDEKIETERDYTGPLSI